MQRARAWCITVNNPSDVEIATMDVLIEDDITEYGCFELEHNSHEPLPGTDEEDAVKKLRSSGAPSEPLLPSEGAGKGCRGGTPHIQGYVYFKNPRTFNVIKTALPRAHIEMARATPEQNRRYCSKEDNGTFRERGVLPKQGRRTDLDNIKEAIKDGSIKTTTDLYEAATSFQAFRMGQIGLSLQPPKKVPPTVIWLHGPTGSGKSLWAHSRFPGAWWSGLADSRFFFEGYAGQDVAVFDDYRGSCLKFSFLLRVLDRYPLKVEVKGSSVWFTAHTIIITSCFSPQEAYAGCGENIDQLLRRLTKTVYTGLKNWNTILGPEVGVILDPTQ